MSVRMQRSKNKDCIKLKNNNNWGQKGEERGVRGKNILCVFSKTMGSSMLGVKASGQSLCRLNAMPNQVLGEWIQRFNGQDQIIRSGNYCCSSIRMASVYENKNSHRKITMTHTQTTSPNCIALHAGKKGRILLRLEPRPECKKNQLKSSNKIY